MTEINNSLQKLAEEILKKNGGWTSPSIISAMCEMYKAALSSTERVECYLPVSALEKPESEGWYYVGYKSEEHKKYTLYWTGEKWLNYKQLDFDYWLKKVTITVVRESDLLVEVRQDSIVPCVAQVDSSNSIEQRETLKTWRGPFEVIPFNGTIVGEFFLVDYNQQSHPAAPDKDNEVVRITGDADHNGYYPTDRGTKVNGICLLKHLKPIAS